MTQFFIIARPRTLYVHVTHVLLVYTDVIELTSQVTRTAELLTAGLIFPTSTVNNTITHMVYRNAVGHQALEVMRTYVVSAGYTILRPKAAGAFPSVKHTYIMSFVTFWKLC